MVLCPHAAQTENLAVPKQSPEHIDMMYIESALKAWSHSRFGLLQALSIARASNLGDTGQLQGNIADLCSAVPSRLGFTSSVPARPLRTRSITIGSSRKEDLVDSATRSMITLLILGLVVVFDEIATSLMKQMGVSSKRMPGDKAYWLLKNLPPKTRWAARGVTELIGIRNALVHGRRSWTENALRLLDAAGVSPLPTIGSPLNPGVEDLFRYQRAVRTALNEIKKLHQAPT